MDNPPGGLPPAPPPPRRGDPRPGRPATPPDDPLVPADFSGWTARIVDAFSRSWRAVGLLQLVLMIPLAVVLAGFQQSAGAVVSLDSTGALRGVHFSHPGVAVTLLVALAVVAIVLGGLVQLASLWVIVKQANGEPIVAAAAARFAFGRLLPMIGWEILAALLVAAGLVALLVPGIYLAVVLLPTLLGVVGLERRGIRRCFELANRNLLALFGRCCVAVLILAAYGELVQVIVNGIFGREATGWAVQIASGLLQLPLDVVGAAFVVITYAELRSRQEPIETARLAAELDR